MIKVYISGPISGLDYDREVIPAFLAAERFINSQDGYSAVNPLNNGLSPNESWTTHMREDIRMLTHCHQIYMLPGWEHSRGARLEWQIAIQLGFTTYEKKSTGSQAHTL